MKKLAILTLLIFSITNLQSQWIILNSGVNNNINDIFFVDTLTGIAVGSQGLILKTNNGGLDWITISTDTINELNSVYFIDSIGIAVGIGGTIIRTTNLGETWTTLSSSTTNDLFSICLSDSGVGNIVGFKSIFLNSQDTGTSWESFTGPLGDVPYARSIQMINKDTGYAVGGYTSFYKTIDGGKNWSGETIVNFSEPPYKHFYDIYFLNDTIGFAVGINYYNELPSKELIFKTIDGGESWTDLTEELYKPLNSIWFIDENIGYSVGSEGLILRTINGGLSWSLQDSHTDNTLNSICFIDSIGFIVGNGGTILKSRNNIINKLIDKENIEFSVWPNPAKCKVVIKAPNQGLIKIYSISGYELMSFKADLANKELNISSLKAGVYIIQYSSQNEIKAQKLIIQ